jgi:dTDP-4-dehydrorhamnose reductase
VATTKEIMSWLITGGLGQLALCLADYLTKKDQTFISLGRRELDVSTTDSISRIVELTPKIIVNCAAYTAVDKAESEPDSALAINSLGVRNVAKAAKELEIPLIHISTDYVFSGESSTPWLIDSHTQPRTTYGKTKLLGEREIGNIYPERTFILRTAWLYSRYGKNFAKSILRSAAVGGNVLKVVNDQIGQPTSALELADRIFCLSKSQAIPGVYHVTNCGEASWYDFACEIFSLTGNDPSRIVPISSSEYKSVANRPKYSVLDNSAWVNQGLPRMSPWKEALSNEMPKMNQQIELEK